MLCEAVKSCDSQNRKHGTYTSLLTVNLRSNSDSGAIHLTGSRPCNISFNNNCKMSAAIEHDCQSHQNIHPLECKDNGATSNSMTLVHWPLMYGLLHLVQRGGAWAYEQGRNPPRPLLAVPNATAHSTHQRPVYPITVVLCKGPLPCGFNVLIKVNL